MASPMAVSIRDKMHPVYAGLLDEFFDRPSLTEVRATCDKCSMCDHDQGAPVAMDFFHPDAKCCTYYPTMPNFLVGALLADPGEDVAEGKRRMRAIIASRMGVTPRWVAPPRKFTLLMNASRSVFGRSTALICPFFDATKEASCTVWRHRENVCTTYYCKYTDGKPGWSYWMALKEYLGHVERELTYWAARGIDPTTREPYMPELRLTREDLEDKAPTDADYAAYWGAWVGREEEFYIQCYERVKALGREEFERHVDDSPNGRGFRAKLASRREDVDTRVVPLHLVKNKKMREHLFDDSVVVTSYNPYDSFKMERDLYDVLGMLKAEETVDENLARLAKEGIELTPELLQHLFTHGLLVPPEKEGATAAEPGNQPTRSVALDASAIARDASADATAATAAGAGTSAAGTGGAAKAWPPGNPGGLPPGPARPRRRGR